MLSKTAFGEPGCNPFLLIQPAVLGSGRPSAPIKVGTVIQGDAESEFVLCSLTLAAATNLTPGQVFQYDKDYNAVLLTTANAVQGQSVGVGRVYSLATPAATYSIWLQRAGHGPIACTAGSVAGALCETTATAGVVNFTNASTAGSRKVAPNVLFATNVQFTANTTINSATLSNVSSTNDLEVGASVAGAGIPANTTLVPFSQPGQSGANNGVPIRSNTPLQLSAAATATAPGVTLTVTGVLNANLMRPTIGTAN